MPAMKANFMNSVSWFFFDENAMTRIPFEFETSGGKRACKVKDRS
jgi:hypothetical protein